MMGGMDKTDECVICDVVGFLLLALLVLSAIGVLVAVPIKVAMWVLGL